ncbi:transposase family protein [Kineococcus arenarius]|uniref:transposase family protein n=1 Tax=Kineococcus sp. SYSU DK007 TaxID=3383128 RepID=UPI003D7ECAD0
MPADTVPTTTHRSLEQGTDTTRQADHCARGRSTSTVRNVRWQQLSVLTGLSERALAELTGRIANSTSTSPQRRQRGRPRTLPPAQRILLIAAALRTNLTTRQLAAVFDLTRSMVQRVVTDITPRLAALDLAGPTAHGRRCVAVLDGTLIPVHDQTLTAPSKDYRRSITVQVVARRCDRLVTALSTPWLGNCKDIVVARAERERLRVDRAREVLADGAYLSLTGINTPAQDSTGRIIRDHAWSLHRRRRASTEHVIARLKD